jgi:hypothetical protein
MDSADQPPKKILKLEISSTFEVPEILLTDPERIIRFGLEVHKGIERHSLEAVHSAKLQEIDTVYQKKIADLTAKLTSYEDQIKDSAQLSREMSREEVTKLLAQGSQQRAEEITYLREEIKKRDERMTALMSEIGKARQDDMSERIGTLLSEIQSFNSHIGIAANRGAVGESYIYEYLATHFSNYNITDTSKNSLSMSDLCMISNDERYKILVEVKNVTSLSVTDRKKFLVDIETSTRSSTINGAILFSLNPGANINSRSFNIVYEHNIPVIYISNVKNAPETIKHTIFIMEELISKNRYYIDSIQKDRQLEDLIKTVQTFHRSLNIDLEQLEKTRRFIITLEAQYKEKSLQITQSNEFIKQMVERYSISLGTTSTIKTEQDRQKEMEDLKASVLKKIEDMGLGISNITQAALTKMGIKPADITRLGGVKQIKEMVKPSTGESGSIKIE